MKNEIEKKKRKKKEGKFLRLRTCIVERQAKK
jgi:hypothetical protein